LRNETPRSCHSTRSQPLHSNFAYASPWCSPRPIGKLEGGEERAFRVVGSVVPGSKPGECTIQSISRSAFNEEILFHTALKEELNKLRYFIDPCVPDPVCRNPEYVQLLEDRASVLLHEHEKNGIPYNLSFDMYIDEIIDEESGRFLRHLVAVQTGALKNMRWKPRDLKICTELPPILEEKKIPHSSEMHNLRFWVDTEGEHYSRTIEGKEYPLTVDEFLEYRNQFEAMYNEGRKKESPDVVRKSSLEDAIRGRGTEPES